MNSKINIKTEHRNENMIVKQIKTFQKGLRRTAVRLYIKKILGLYYLC